MLKILTITLGTLNYIFGTYICMLMVFLFDTLTMVAEATKTCQCTLTYNKIYVVDVHLLVCYILLIYTVENLFSILVSDGSKKKCNSEHLNCNNTKFFTFELQYLKSLS